jgi:hypothetical protein
MVVARDEVTAMIPDQYHDSIDARLDATGRTRLDATGRTGRRRHVTVAGRRETVTVNDNGRIEVSSVGNLSVDEAMVFSAVLAGAAAEARPRKPSPLEAPHRSGPRRRCPGSTPASGCDRRQLRVPQSPRGFLKVGALWRLDGCVRCASYRAGPWVATS